MTGVPESGRPLRVGVMCNGRRFPAWQAAAIRSLQAVPGVSIALLIVRDGAGSASKAERLKDVPRLAWTLYNKGYVEKRSRASRGIDMSEALADVPEVRCTTVPVGKFGERFSDADLATMREYDLDIVLRFSFGIIKGEILTLPRHGVWSFHHGDERSFRGRPPGFWELVEGEPIVGAILQRLTERLDGGVVLHRGFFRTYPHSYLRTRDTAFLESADWPSVVIRQLQSGDTSLVDAEPTKTDAPVRYDPTNSVMLRFLAGQVAAFVRTQFNGMFKAATWTIGTIDAPIASLLADEPPSITWLPPQRKGRYLADPFAIEIDGEPIALVEDYDYTTHRGVISAVELSGKGKPKKVLDTGVHASYPYLLQHDGEVYCIPETYQERKVCLYKATSFPDTWEQVGALVDDIAAVDSTVFQHDGRWWLLCTDQDGAPNTKLRVFYSDALEGPWSPHALNPVKTDIRSSRPAGTPFVHEGDLYRPTQDCSETYGGGVTITRIDELTPTTFHETAVKSLQPDSSSPFRHGLHTVAAVGDRTIVDGRRDSFVWPAFRREFGSRVRKILRRS